MRNAKALKRRNRNDIIFNVRVERQRSKVEHNELFSVVAF